MLNKLVNMVKRAIVTNIDKDKDNFARTQVQYMGKTKTIEVITPYGLYSNCPKDGIFLLFQVGAQEQNICGIGNTPERRFKELKEGEVAIYNVLSGNYIHFNEDGDTAVYTSRDSSITIDRNETISIAGNQTITIEGNQSITVEGNQTVVVEGDQTIEVDGNQSITVDGDQTIDVTGDADITADTVTIDSISGTTIIDSNLQVLGTVTAYEYNTGGGGSGNMVATGTIRTTDDVIAKYGTRNVSLDQHVHIDVQAGSDDSGIPKA